jgi:hypothetical protein
MKKSVCVYGVLWKQSERVSDLAHSLSPQRYENTASLAVLRNNACHAQNKIYLPEFFARNCRQA